MARSWRWRAVNDGCSDERNVCCRSLVKCVGVSCRQKDQQRCLLLNHPLLHRVGLTNVSKQPKNPLCGKGGEGQVKIKTVLF